MSVSSRWTSLAILGLGLLVPVTSGSLAHGDPLSRVTCTPTKGTVTTVFQFSVIYYGKTDPQKHDLYLDNSVVPMAKGVPAPGGGTTYTYSSRLTFATHKYRVRFEAGGKVLRMPGPGDDKWYTGPTVVSPECITINGFVKLTTGFLADTEIRVSKAGAIVETAKTSNTGGYTIIGLAPGTYVITAVKAGYQMDPVAKTETVPSGATRIVTFRATKL